VLRLLGCGALTPLRALPRVVDDGNRAGIGLGVVLERVKPDLVPVRVVQPGRIQPMLAQWLIDTSTILDAAETYLLITRLMGWDLDAYENWLATTGARLARIADGNS
jgi:hypothetical protein